jgi:CheY-like chemotaxis protein
MRVLVAEDHERLARAVAAGLRRYGMIVDVALDGDDALARLGASRYDPRAGCSCSPPPARSRTVSRGSA